MLGSVTRVYYSMRYSLSGAHLDPIDAWKFPDYNLADRCLYRAMLSIKGEKAPSMVDISSAAQGTVP